MKIVGVEPEIIELRRLGKFKSERKKPRTLLVTLQNQRADNLILAKINDIRGKIEEMNIFLSRTLSLEGSKFFYLSKASKRTHN